MLLNYVTYDGHNHNQKENKPGFFSFPNNDPELRLKWIIVCKREEKNGKPWNSSGKNVYICGDLFVKGTSSPQKSGVFLKWKFLAFGESPCKLENFRVIHIDSFFTETVKSLLTDKSGRGKSSYNHSQNI